MRSFIPPAQKTSDAPRLNAEPCLDKGKKRIKIIQMNKVLLFSLFVLAVSLPAFSQVSQETIEFNKQKQSAFKMEYNFPEEALQKALENRMEQLGYRAKEEKGFLNRDKGFMVHKGAFVTEVTEKSMDYVFKIEPRAKKDKNGSVLYMVIMKDGTNAASALTDIEVERVKGFLTHLAPEAESSHLEMQIKGQEENLAKSEKKFKTLQSDSLSLENKLRETRLELDNIIKSQTFQQKEVENQKKLLDEMKAKRK
jgi:hypothetical protein